jgi:uncharacterized protein
VGDGADLPIDTPMAWDRDVLVPMRDGVRLCVDVYRPQAAGRFPALLAIAPHNKELQTPDISGSVPPQPAWSTMWQGGAEAGDSAFFISRGYVHVVGNPRGFGKSEDGGSAEWDTYDLIEWAARQPWCSGAVGMVGLSAFAMAQWAAAQKQPPSLKAIFPFDAGPAYGTMHDRNPGGLLHVMLYLLDGQSVHHGGHGRPGELPPAQQALWEAAMANPDYRMYSWVYNLLSQKGQVHPRLFQQFLDPYEAEGAYETTEAGFKQVKVPAYTGAGWHAYSYNMHLMGAQNHYAGIDVPKKLLFTGPTHMERPFNAIHGEMVRWFDHWLKGIDTGVMQEPPVKLWVQGANAWREADDWPLPETRWTKFYLDSWERLRTDPFVPGGRDIGYDEPDTFVQMPPTHTRRIAGLRYLSEPMAEDTLVCGPLALNFFAEVDQDDTNWIIVVKDVGPDVSLHSGRPGEFEPPTVPERELTRGWLKASNRALDEARSTPWRPWHRLTRAARQPVVPGEINEYRVELLSMANQFRRGHRICVEITSLDLPSGVGFGNNTEYVPYHICSSRTVVHKVHRSARYPSHLVVPVIPSSERCRSAG